MSQSGWSARCEIGAMRLIRQGFHRCQRAALRLAGSALWPAGGYQRPGTHRDDVVDLGLGAPSSTSTDTITVMTWNMAYARGVNEDNSVNDAGTRATVAQRLEGMAALVRERGVDVLLLQEIDFASRRSHHVDQMRVVGRAGGFRYGARAVSWRANYIPYPYWPPSQHYGPVLSGGAVLSRFPICQNLVTLHPKPSSQPWWYNLFYLFRYAQFVQVEIQGTKRWVVNNHLEAFDTANRMEQARALSTLVSVRRNVLCVGGDMNCLPN